MTCIQSFYLVSQHEWQNKSNSNKINMTVNKNWHDWFKIEESINLLSNYSDYVTSLVFGHVSLHIGNWYDNRHNDRPSCGGSPILKIKHYLYYYIKEILLKQIQSQNCQLKLETS